MAIADVLLTTQGQRVENIRVQSYFYDVKTDEDSEFDIEIVENGKLTGEHKMFSEAEVQSIEFREPDAPTEPMGRVAHIEGTSGDTKYHVIVERADRVGDQLVFRVRLPSEPPGGKAMRAKAEQIDSISFAPSMMETSAKAAGKPGTSTAPAKALLVRGPFPWLGYMGTLLVGVVVVAAGWYFGMRKKVMA
ncbi:MAG: hypothetical protein ABI579_01365 [Candidatus Sumerlaeota bacterium]